MSQTSNLRPRKTSYRSKHSPLTGASFEAFRCALFTASYRQAASTEREKFEGYAYVPPQKVTPLLRLLNWSALGIRSLATGFRRPPAIMRATCVGPHSAFLLQGQTIESVTRVPNRKGRAYADRSTPNGRPPPSLKTKTRGRAFSKRRWNGRARAPPPRRSAYSSWRCPSQRIIEKLLICAECGAALQLACEGPRAYRLIA